MTTMKTRPLSRQRLEWLPSCSGPLCQLRCSKMCGLFHKILTYVQAVRNCEGRIVCTYGNMYTTSIQKPKVASKRHLKRVIAPIVSVLCKHKLLYSRKLSSKTRPRKTEAYSKVRKYVEPLTSTTETPATYFFLLRLLKGLPYCSMSWPK